MYVALFPGPCPAFRCLHGLVHFSFTLAEKWERGYLIRTAKTQSTELAMLAHTRTVQGRRDNKKGWNVFLHVVNIISCTLCMYMYINTAYYKGLVTPATQVCCTSFHNARRKVVRGSVTTCLLLNNVHTAQECGYMLL